MNSQTATALLASSIFDVVLGLVLIALGGTWMLVGSILTICGLGVGVWAALKLRG